MTEEAQKIIKTIKQMEASLDEEKQMNGFDLESTALRVTYPLNDCLRDLKEKYNIISRLHRERFEQVKKLVQALESYSSHLESSFVKIQLPPTNSATCPANFDLSPSYVTLLDDEFTKIYDEYNKRVGLVQTIAEEIIRLWSELGTPQAQTDSAIVNHYRESPEQLGLHQADLDRIKLRRDKLIDEKRSREKRLQDIKVTIEGLWDRLGVEEQDRKSFLAGNRGFGLRVINEFEEELARLNELKRQNLHLFVEDARVRLQELWDSLYFSEEEMLDFTPAFSDVYSDALLSAHEAEVQRLQTLKEQRAPVLEKIEKHRSLIADRETLAASANDASRLMLKPAKGEKRDPTRLLREEKMRKRIAKELPKIAAELTKTLESYEEDYGRPFLVHGDRYLDELYATEIKAPPARSKTPNGLPPRSKTPSAPAVAPAKSAPSSTNRAAIAPSRPASVMRGPPPRSATKTPTGYREPVRHAAPASTTLSSSIVPPSSLRSPSKLPTRLPLAHLQHGGNSPDRRQALVAPKQHQHSLSQSQAELGSARTEAMPGKTTMGPPRAPPPRMRDLFEQPQQSNHNSSVAKMNVNPLIRPASVSSSADSSTSGRFVRPVSPEDVYDDRERMSYMSASLLNHNTQNYQHPIASQHAHTMNASMQRHYAPSTISSSYPSSNTMSSQAPSSRQISNSSSNITSACGSENWETYSDASEIEPERDSRQDYYAKLVANQGTTSRPGLGTMMAPPPKMRVNALQQENVANNMALMRVHESMED